MTRRVCPAFFSCDAFARCHERFQFPEIFQLSLDRAREARGPFCSNREGNLCLSYDEFVRPRLSSPEISGRSSVDWTSSRLAREASSLANYPARVPLVGHVYTHTQPSTHSRAHTHTQSHGAVTACHGDQVEGKRKRSARTRGKRQKENKKTKQRAAARLARRATIKIARSNRRAWCSFDVLYLSVILPSFPTPTGHREISAHTVPILRSSPREPHRHATRARARTHTYDYIYNTSGGGDGIGSSHARKQCVHECFLLLLLLLESLLCVSKRGCMIPKDVHPTCTGVLIKAYQ